jgi:hypothetical protein
MALPGALLNYGTLIIALIVVGCAYWFFAPVLSLITGIFTNRYHLDLLGQAVLDPGWKIARDVSGSALRGTFRGRPVHFQYLPRRFEPDDLVLMLECPVLMNIHLTKETPPLAEISAKSLARLWAIPGASDLFLIERPGLDLSRLSVVPIQWLNKSGALLKGSGSWESPWGEKEFREALEALLEFRTLYAAH